MVSGFPTSGGRARAVVARLGLAGALRARSGSGGGGGGFRRPRRLPGLGAGTGNPSAASVPLSQASPPSVEAAPILGGKPRQRWRALGRPRGTGVVPRGPLGDTSDRAARCLQGGGAEASSSCVRAERAAAIVVNPNLQSLRRRSALIPCFQLTAHTVWFLPPKLPSSL